MDKSLYYLIDLKGSITSSNVQYWKVDKLSSTSDVREAGIFTLDEAVAFVNNDLENNTVMILEEKVKEFSAVSI
ncbi:hypothetical protein WKH56_06610 [Priestia sp. SB1]|uniref:Uncharacterized protein n=1 Tax=Priestia aryabhattai TaxID=412384 RepID=A0AAX6NCW3_PRIAR|nr:hypothetical protein [Priestia aryabhattai]MDU9693345.1 hypothetical protein [Priestia aryabhattai]